MTNNLSKNEINTINIVCYEEVNRWILGKFAINLNSELNNITNINSKITNNNSEPGDVSHHIIYLDTKQRVSNTETFMITHVDSRAKINKIKKLLHEFDLGICMSRNTKEQLIREGIKKNRLLYVNPAHDFKAKAKKTIFGIASKTHNDGRKKERSFIEHFSQLPSENIELHIMGSGWSEYVNFLRSKKFTVKYYPEFDSIIYYEIFLPQLDYFLYWSWDEGSMGFLDAIYAGVKTIATPQGFHLDIDSGIDISINDEVELIEIIRDILRDKSNRQSRVSKLTWKNYADSHLQIWQMLNYYNSNSPLIEIRDSELPSAKKKYLTKIYQKNNVHSNLMDLMQLKLAWQLCESHGLEHTKEYFNLLTTLYSR